MKTLTAHEQPLAKIFSDDYVFTIPGYQRPYSWRVEHASELIEDILGFMRSTQGKLDELPPYFLGSIVLIKDDTQPAATVVDGQQRMTTVTLLLSAIRARVSDENIKKGISRLIYDQGDVILNTSNHYRLSLREKDRDFFRKFVQHDGGIEQLANLGTKLSDSQNRLRENARFFLKFLEKMEVAEALRLAQFIATRCYLVAVCTADLDSAFRIFNVLNSRGLDLSATDILKAEITAKIPDTKREDYTKIWEQLEEDLGRENFNDLFSYIRNIYRKAKPQGTLLKEFRDHVKFSKPEIFIDEILSPMAEAFREIIDASYTSQNDARQINNYIRWINRIEFKDWIPPALAFLIRNRNDFEKTLRFLRDLEILVYSMLIRKLGINDRIERCSRLTAAIEENDDLWSKDSPLQLSAAEQFATYNSLSGPIYDTHSVRALSTILLRLDSLMSSGGAEYDYPTISVEHVLPQTPKLDSEWIEWIPEVDVRRGLVHRLGNLALLTRRKNSSAKNFDFKKKKAAYFTKNGVSPFVLTTQVLNTSIWNEEHILSRQKELLEKLEQHFKLQDRKHPDEILLAELS